jgi:TonB-dependent starch-binding outer membrane protein SusC
MKYNLLFIALFSFSTLWVQAQEIKVSGKVSEAGSGGLPGVNVLVKGTSQGTVTDIDGNFTISVGSDATLVFSFIGFVTEEVVVGARTSIEVKLSPDIRQLSEVVVIGYGTQVKREITGSVSKVEGRKIMETSTPSFEAALQGQASGVQVIQGSGLAGSGSVIRIRGIASISAGADPLYVVDGIPITADNFLAEANWQNGAFNNNPLSAINPNDIQSIEILKDAAATGIYGSRGANGVVLVTTKRGKIGKPSFNFSSNVGISNAVAKPKLLNSAEWLQVRQEAWENDGNTGAVWIPGYSNVDDAPADRLTAFQEASQHDTDWWDLMTQTGIKQQYDLSMNYGTKKLKTYVGMSYSENESYVKDNKLRRMSGRVNLDYKVSDNLEVSLSSSLSQGINRRVRVAYTGGLGDAMSTALPVYQVFDSNGDYWRGEAGTIVANPVFTNDNFEGYTVDNRTINTLSLKYSPIEKLKLTVSGGYDYLDQRNDQWESAALRGNPNSRAERDTRFVNNYNMSLLADYDLSKDAHKVKLLVGSEYQKSITSGSNNEVYLNVNSTQFKKDGDFSEINRDGVAEQIENIEFNFLSYFARVNYTFNDKYIVQGTARVDGSSKFGPDNRFGFFPVLSAAWLLSEEDFMKNVNFVDFLKVKAAYGITGNSQFPSDQWRGTLKLEPAPGYNGQPIRYPDVLPNPDLKWEAAKNLDLGLEMGLFNNFIEAEISYYRKNSEGVIVSLQIPQYNGYANLYDNVSDILNEGIEITLNTNNIEKGDFTWTSNFNFAYNYNEVLSLGGYSPESVSGGTNDIRVVVGQPVGTNFLIRYAGVDPESGKPKYLDGNGNETFEYNEQRDRVAAGKVLPDAIGSFGNVITYKSFTLNFLFVYSIGGQIYDSSSKRQLAFLSDWVTREDIGDRWREPGDVATYPRVTLDPVQHGNDKEWFNTDLYVRDASYARLRNLSIGYELPENVIGKLGLNRANIVLSGTNLLTFTKFPGLDPEVARDFDNQQDRNLSQSVTYLTPPQEKVYNLSINLSF